MILKNPIIKTMIKEIAIAQMITKLARFNPKIQLNSNY